MSIVYNYLALTPDLLERACADEELARSLIHRESDTELPGLLARIDIDKAWDGVAYLLSAERRATDDLYPPTELLARAVLGGDEPLGSGQFDEGREPQILNRDVVRLIAAAIGNLKPGDLTRHYDLEVMTKVDVYAASASVDYFLNAFRKLKSFYATAAKAGAAVVIFSS